MPPGVAVTLELVELIIQARAVLILIGLALFMAAGLEPAVAWLTRRHVPRWAAVIVILLAVLGVVVGFLAEAIPRLRRRPTDWASQLPRYMHSLQDHNSELGRLNARFHLQQRLSSLLAAKGASLIGGVLGAAELVLGAVASMRAVAAPLRPAHIAG